MKKRVGIILLIVSVLTMMKVFAVNVTFEELESDEKPPLRSLYSDDSPEFPLVEKMGFGGDIVQIDDDMYCLGSGRGSTSLPVKLSGDHLNGPNCIWTGKYYYVRYSGIDGIWSNPEKYAYPLMLFDEEGNEVKRKELRRTWNSETNEFISSFYEHSTKIGYLNDTYYCQLLSGDVIKSTDFENWEYTDEEVPQQLGTKMVRGDKISFNREEFYPVVYETDTELEFFNTLGDDWVIYMDREMDLYFSNDHIYFVKAEVPQEFREVYKFAGRAVSEGVMRAYENEEDILIDILKKVDMCQFRLHIPKEEIYQQLDEMKNAAYVRYADQILAFETPPVLENDRTLVPMRFLFEQLGAEVDWDNDTQTATATIMPKEDAEVADGAVAAKAAVQPQTIRFSIDDTIAQVNGQATEMDVPARMVNDKTMVPLRFLSEQMGYTVTWDAETNTAVVE